MPRASTRKSSQRSAVAASATPTPLPAKNAFRARGFASFVQRLEGRENIQYELRLKQQPVQAQVVPEGSMSAFVIQPYPVVQLRIVDLANAPRESSLAKPNKAIHLSNPYYIVHASLISSRPTTDLTSFHVGSLGHSYLVGSTASSLWRAKDAGRRDVGTFVFPEIGVRVAGDFRLKFTLHEIVGRDVLKCAEVISAAFRIIDPDRLGMLSSRAQFDGIQLEQRHSADGRAEGPGRTTSSGELAYPTCVDDALCGLRGHLRDSPRHSVDLEPPGRSGGSGAVLFEPFCTHGSSLDPAANHLLDGAMPAAHAALDPHLLLPPAPKRGRTVQPDILYQPYSTTEGRPQTFSFAPSTGLADPTWGGGEPRLPPRMVNDTTEPASVESVNCGSAGISKSASDRPGHKMRLENLIVREASH